MTDILNIIALTLIVVVVFVSTHERVNGRMGWRDWILSLVAMILFYLAINLL